jgi:tRNA(fMet)-specific endonuclease VapC
MAYLLDTNICIYIRKEKSIELKSKISSIDNFELLLSSITVAELEFGVAKSSQPKKNSEALKIFLSSFRIIDFDRNAAAQYGYIRAFLEKKGTPIGANDLLIASIAKSLDLTLVTNNEREFSRVEGLKIENWIKGN